MKILTRLLPIALLFLLITPADSLITQERGRQGRRPRQESEAAASESAKSAIPEAWIDALRWRSIGPANMGGRITALAVWEKNPSTYWAATASGGLLKTVNNGTTFEHQFDHEATVSIGDVDICQSEPDVVWVGTGESNPRNSVSWGDGVYKSIDGGKTWKNMGLRESFQIGSVLVHPEDPNTVYVGALGRLWGPNEERGLFKTVDGGETWDKVLYVNENTGVIDAVMHPEDPDTLLIATYERRRDEFDTNDPAKKWGWGSALYKTTNGGLSFHKITEGLPTGKLGRIGLDYYRADPNRIYMVLESDRISQEPDNAAYAGVESRNADAGARITRVVEDSPAEAAGLKVDDIVLAVEDETIHSSEDLNNQIRSRLAGDTIQVEVSRERESVMLEMTFDVRPENKEDEGGRNGGRSNGSNGSNGDDKEKDADAPPPPGPFHGGLGGQRQNAQEQQGPDGFEYGGIYRSDDGGDSWVRINSLNPRPMYFSRIRVDPSDDQYLYVLGISLYRSKDGGETFTGDGHGGDVHVDHHAMWINPNDGQHIVLGNDGGMYVSYDRMSNWDHLNHVAIGQFYQITTDSEDDYRVYGGLQDNGSWGGPSRSRTHGGPINHDWVSIGGGDGFVCRVDENDPDLIYYESQNGGMGRRHLTTGERGFLRPRSPRGSRYRFNWNTPFILSAHNSKIYYSAGNHVFRSLDRGEGMKAISPEISHTDRGSATALAESPRNAEVLYVGTDDGALWATTDGGQEWKDLFAVEEAPAEGEGERRGRGAGGGRLLEFDENKDGKLTRDELPEQMAERMFERLDLNSDNIIDAKELEDMRGRGFGGGRGGPAGRRSPRGESRQARPSTSEAPPSTNEAAPEASAQDPVSGDWEGKLSSDEMPSDQGGFSMTIKLGEEGRFSGTYSSEFMDGDVKNGRYDADSGSIRFQFSSDVFTMDIKGKLSEGKMSGKLEAEGGMFSADFSATRGGAGQEAVEQDPDRAGHEWSPLAEAVPGRFHVSSIVASRYKDSRVYASFDGHRSNDDMPHVLLSEDHGKSWRSIRANLPDNTGSVRVISEDLENEDLLFLGTEFGAWASIDRGGSWTRINSNLPTVAVHDFALHPTRGELVAGTHGRSVWIADITPLRQMSGRVVSERVHLYKPNRTFLWRGEPSRGRTNRRFVGENPPSSAQIFYSLTREPRRIQLEITDLRGETLAELTAPKTAGLHRVSWDLRRESNSGGRRRFRPRVDPGEYIVRLDVDGTIYTQELEVEIDPEFSDPQWLTFEREAELMLLEQEEEGEEEITAPKRQVY